MSNHMTYDEYYGEVSDDIVEDFADIDQLLEMWGQFLHRELQPFKVIRSDMFGSGCVCDLKTMFTEQNFSPDFVMTLVPRVKDCYTQCLVTEYNKNLNIFLSAYVNISGAPMTVADLGSDEPYFYQMFLDIVKDKVIFNSWDLWSTTRRAGN
jgi:hypothetical protein